MEIYRNSYLLYSILSEYADFVVVVWKCSTKPVLILPVFRNLQPVIV